MLTAKFLRGVGAFMLLAVVVITFHLLPGLDNSAIQHEVRNALHIVGFAFIAAIICRLLPANFANFDALSPAVVLVVSLALTAAIAGMAEFSQIIAGKNFDPIDLTRGAGGAALYLGSRFLWGRSINPDLSTAARYSLRGLSVLVASLVFVPLIYVFFIGASIAARFPTILNFDSRWDSWIAFPVYAEIRYVAAGPSFVEFDGRVAEIQLLRPDWSGIRIESVVSDWSDYQHIVLSARLVNAAGNSHLSVHLSDGNHAGVRTQHVVGGATVGEQSSTIRIALEGNVDLPTRPDLDLSNIEQVYIICHGEHDGAVLFIDNILLE